MGMPALKESEIRQQVKEFLQWRGWFVFYNLQGLGCYPGLSDLVAVKHGKVVFIELKTKRGKQSNDQKAFQHNLELAGGTYIVARGIEDVENL